MNVLKSHLQYIIWTLLEVNASQQKIERVTGIYRYTIHAYQQRIAVDFTNYLTSAQPSPLASPVSMDKLLCTRHREFIEAQLRLKRNVMAISRNWPNNYQVSQVAAIALDQLEKALATSPSTKTPASRP